MLKRNTELGKQADAEAFLTRSHIQLGAGVSEGAGWAWLALPHWLRFPFRSWTAGPLYPDRASDSPCRTSPFHKNFG